MYLSFLTNVSSSPSWSPEKPLRRLVHNRGSSVQTYRYFNQLISNHLKDFILDDHDIQTIDFLPSRLYYDSVQIAITQKGVINIRLRAASSFSFETLYNASTREGREASGEAARNEGEPQSLLLFCTFKLTVLGSPEKWITVHGLHHVN